MVVYGVLELGMMGQFPHRKDPILYYLCFNRASANLYASFPHGKNPILAYLCFNVVPTSRCHQTAVSGG